MALAGEGGMVLSEERGVALAGVQRRELRNVFKNRILYMYV